MNKPNRNLTDKTKSDGKTLLLPIVRTIALVARMVSTWQCGFCQQFVVVMGFFWIWALFWAFISSKL